MAPLIFLSIFSSASSTLTPSTHTPTTPPHLIHEQFITIIVSAPTRTYTSYIELITSSSSSNPDNDNVTSYTVDTHPSANSQTNPVVGIVVGCVIGMIVLAVLGYMRWERRKRKGRDRRRKRRRGKKRGAKKKVRIVEGEGETEKGEGNEGGGEQTGNG
ncbi:hypothetical protein CJF32_00003145 [Rutstroemia sp. NJR-2017a WRK4]|nr:hypothetical protein CJF32_00003145 [Rutstroemia sp. NJR-2017a WRK4]